MAITSTGGTGHCEQVRRSAGHRLLVPAQRGPVASGLNPAGILLAIAWTGSSTGGEMVVSRDPGGWLVATGGVCDGR
jgi:hypothetical protein